MKALAVSHTKDTEMPVFRTAAKKVATNRCDWSTDGHSFASGDVGKVLFLYILFDTIPRVSDF